MLWIGLACMGTEVAWAKECQQAFMVVLGLLVLFAIGTSILLLLC
jgi:hypothetical protein